jgi:hypothetical protein
MRIRCIAISLVLTMILSCAEEPAGTAIENVTVIDPVSGMTPDQRVVINEGRIVRVESMSDPALGVTAVLDATGKFLIPGLWDMHVHFLYDAALTEQMPSLFLDYGITSVRDTGGNLEQMVTLTERLEASPTPSPAIYFAGPLLDGRFVVYDGGDPGRPELGIGIPDPDSARAYVQQLKDSGADLIKIYELVDPAVYRVLAAAARDAGLPIASHVPLMMTADAAGPLADSMEHLRNLELACAADWEALLAVRQETITGFIEGRGYDLRRSLHSLQRLPAIAAYDEARCDAVLSALDKTIQVPTLRLNTLATTLPFEHPDWPAALARLPESVRERWQASADQLRAQAPLADRTFSDWSLFLVSRLKHNNVPIGAGTDTPIGIGIPGWSLHSELELLVRGGLTPLEALYAATVQAARFLRLDADIGRIQAGMQADLVLLHANPLDDIGNTRRIGAVMKRGEWVR